MKIMTILGTRPEIIRLSLIIGKLDQLAEQHVLVHTGQNFDPRLSGCFFEQMGIRLPDVQLQGGVMSLGAQLGTMFGETEKLLLRERPDRVLVLGDTNSALCAVLAERYGIPVYHMEAGNRCRDTSVPEEINRKIIDAVSTCNMPYTPQARENLILEGIAPQRIWTTGNPIYEVILRYEDQIEASGILQELGLDKGQYFLVTFHRAENVDHPERLKGMMRGLELVAEEFGLPVVCSVHPRTRDRLVAYGASVSNPLIRFCEPFGFFDFVHLEKYARCVLTDSGTVQEECCILGTPAVTVRRSTERTETIQCGSNMLSGLAPERIAACVRLMTSGGHDWDPPEGYMDRGVSDKAVHFILGEMGHV